MNIKKYFNYLIMITILAGESYSQVNVNTLSSNLPLVVIDTDGKTIRDEPKIMARMGIIDNGKDNRNKII